MMRTARFERVLIERFRGQHVPASTTDPREAQRQFDEGTA